MASEILSKLCTKCGVVKNVSEFSRSRSRKDGLNGHCKACIKKKLEENKEKYSVAKRLAHERNRDHNNARSARWREQNKDYAKAYMSVWLVDNKQMKSDSDRLYREKNSDYVKEAKRNYYDLNRDRVKEKTRKYQIDNAEKLRPYKAAYARKRNAVKRMACPAWADQLKILSFYEKAVKLTCDLGVRYEVDHIVPVQSKIVCGLHCESNLRVVSMSENRSKGNRWWPDMP